jgi:glycosyltransferase involved in cell wall biosynthesis
MKLSVVIPCYNEHSTIEALIDAVRASPWSPKEVVVVDDASTDGTRELLTTRLRSKIDRLILQERNQGKGAALRAGFRAATGDMVIVQDADLEYDPQEYRKLVLPITTGRADVVYGSRFITGESRRVLYYWHCVGNHVLTTLSNMFTNLNLSDMETCYKVFRRDVLEKIQIEENRFGFEPEITAKVAKLRCRVYEVGISYSGRTYEEGKKIGVRDGLRALWCILKYNVFRPAAAVAPSRHTAPAAATAQVASDVA